MTGDRTAERGPVRAGSVASEGRGDVVGGERLDSWTVFMRVLPCPAVCERKFFWE